MSEENVVRRLREEPKIEVPAIGCSFTTNLGGDRQIVLQTHFAQDMSEDTINGLLDRMLKIGDRQKAKYDLENAMKEFETRGRTLRDLFIAIPDAKRNHAKEDLELATTVDMLRQEQEQVRDNAYAEFTEGGRRGAFKLKGHAEVTYNRIGAEIAKTQERQKTVHADRGLWKQTQNHNIQRFREDLAAWRKKVNEMRALIGGLEPETAYAEYETCAIPEI